MQDQTCYLLSYVKYGDNDAFLHCYSAESGYQSFFAKGIYTSKNKKKPYLFPLNLLNISIRKTSKFNSVSKLELAPDFYDFTGIKTNAALFFVADFLQQILKEEGANTTAFKEIQNFKSEIKNENPDAFIVLVFNFLKIAGIAPLYKEEKFLDPESGTFSDQISHPFFTEEISKLWLLYLKTDDPYSIRLKRTERNYFLDSIILYYQIHFSGFYVPNSLAVLRQIFE